MHYTVWGPWLFFLPQNIFKYFYKLSTKTGKKNSHMCTFSFCDLYTLIFIKQTSNIELLTQSIEMKCLYVTDEIDFHCTSTEWMGGETPQNNIFFRKGANKKLNRTGLLKIY